MLFVETIGIEPTVNVENKIIIPISNIKEKYKEQNNGIIFAIEKMMDFTKELKNNQQEFQEENSLSNNVNKESKVINTQDILSKF